MSGEQVLHKRLDPEWNEVFVLLLADMPGNLFLSLKMVDSYRKPKMST